MAGDVQFAAWSCGHDHQIEADGSVHTCRPKPAWFLLEVSDRFAVLSSPQDGLAAGDYTLHTLNPDDQTYSPASCLTDTAPLRYADAHKRRLLIYHGDGRWVPVMP